MYISSVTTLSRFMFTRPTVEQYVKKFYGTRNQTLDAGKIKYLRLSLSGKSLVRTNFGLGSSK